MVSKKYYLVHTVIDPKPKKIIKILKDGYLLSSSKSKQFGLCHGEYLDYVYFMLLGSERIPFGIGGVTFIIDSSILSDHSFRYALSWIGGDIDRSIKVKRNDDVKHILDKIDNHIQSVHDTPDNPTNKMLSHEILIKNSVDLNKYLIAICCSFSLSSESINYLKKHYPNVLILNEFPKSACNFETTLENHHKYRKYKSKYLKLKQAVK